MVFRVDTPQGDRDFMTLFWKIKKHTNKEWSYKSAYSLRKFGPYIFSKELHKGRIVIGMIIAQKKENLNELSN